MNIVPLTKKNNNNNLHLHVYPQPTISANDVAANKKYIYFNKKINNDRKSTMPNQTHEHKRTGNI